MIYEQMAIEGFSPVIINTEDHHLLEEIICRFGINNVVKFFEIYEYVLRYQSATGTNMVEYMKYCNEINRCLDDLRRCYSG